MFAGQEEALMHASYRINIVTACQFPGRDISLFHLESSPSFHCFQKITTRLQALALDSGLGAFQIRSGLAWSASAVSCPLKSLVTSCLQHSESLAYVGVLTLYGPSTFVPEMTVVVAQPLKGGNVTCSKIRGIVDISAH